MPLKMLAIAVVVFVGHVPSHVAHTLLWEIR